MTAPGGESGKDRFGDILLVVGVGDRDGVGVGRGDGGDLDGDGGAGEVIEWADGGTAKNDGEFGVLDGEANLVGEAEALGDGGGLGCVPGDGGVRLVGAFVERGGDDVHAAAAVGGVQDEAGGGMSVIDDLGALIGGEDYGRVGLACGQDRETAGGEESAKAGGEGEGDIFFEEIAGQVGTGVGTAVGRVDEDRGVRGGLLGGSDAVHQKKDGEHQRELFEGERQSRLVDCKG